MLHDDVRGLLGGLVLHLGYETGCSHQVSLEGLWEGGSCLAAGHLFADLRSHGAIRPRPDGFKHILGSRQRGAMPLHEPRPVVGERAHAASWLDCRDRMVPSRSP